MTWTYSGNPTTSAKDAVRCLLGDTDESFPLMQDEEIAYVQGVSDPLYGSDDFMAASVCADLIANAFAREIAISADGVSAGADQLQKKFTDTAINLRAMYTRIRGVGAEPYAGGIDAFSPPDFSVKPLVFGLAFTDNNRAGQQNYGNYGEYPSMPEIPDSGFWTGD